MQNVFCILTILAAGICFAGEQSRAPELDRLEHYLGEWEVTQTVRITDQPEVVDVGALTVEWMLEKQFMRFYIKSNDEKKALSCLQIIGFDPLKRVYRLWSYGSDGVTYDADGEWNAKTKRWEWKGKLSNGLDMTNVDGFVDEHSFEFVTKVFDPAGKLLAECIGRGRRKKKAESAKQP